jgi:hypothetical protein
MSERIFKTLKFGSGMLLMVYVLMHLFNHSPGLISIAVADSFRVSVMGALHLPVLCLLIPGALLILVLTPLYAVACRLISEAGAQRCTRDLSSHPVHQIEVRGVRESILVQAIFDAASVEASSA